MAEEEGRPSRKVRGLGGRRRGGWWPSRVSWGTVGAGGDDGVPAGSVEVRAGGCRGEVGGGQARSKGSGKRLPRWPQGGGEGLGQLGLDGD